MQQRARIASGRKAEGSDAACAPGVRQRTRPGLTAWLTRLGGVAALPYALAGGVLSLASMCLLSRMKWMHPVTVSIVGGVMHNVGQIVMAMIILHTSQLAYYMAVLMLSGILFGALTGVSATLVMKHMKHIKQWK